MTEPVIIELTRYLPHASARVWAALTDPAIHAKWWAAGDVRASVGHRFTLGMGRGWPGVLERLEGVLAEG